MSADDLFDPARLRGLWAGKVEAEAPPPPADEAQAADPAAALLARLEAELARELGPPAARLEPLVRRARAQFAARQEAADAKAAAAASEELLGLLDDIEDVVEALELAPAVEARA